MIEGNLVHGALLHTNLWVGSSAVAAAIVAAGLIYRQVGGARFKALTWLLGSYLVTFSTFSLGQAIWELTDRMGLSFFLGAAIGGLAMLIASGWPLKPIDPKLKAKTHAIALLFGSAIAAVAAMWWQQGIFFFHPELWPLMLADWLFVATGIAAIAAGLLLFKRPHTHVRMSDYDTRLSERTYGSASAQGLVGLFAGTIAATIAANFPVLSAILPPWVIPILFYALFEFLPRDQWSTSLRGSIGTFLGAATGFYLMSYYSVFGMLAESAPMIVVIFSAIGFSIEKIWLWKSGQSA